MVNALPWIDAKQDLRTGPLRPALDNRDNRGSRCEGTAHPDSGWSAATSAFKHAPGARRMGTLIAMARG